MNPMDRWKVTFDHGPVAKLTIYDLAVPDTPVVSFYAGPDDVLELGFALTTLAHNIKRFNAQSDDVGGAV